jgi:hypothetical protein
MGLRALASAFCVAKSLRPSFYVWEATGLPNRAAGHERSAFREGRVRMAAQDHDGVRSPSVKRAV